MFGERDKITDTLELKHHELLNNPTDKSKYKRNYNYNRNNHNDKYAPDDDPNWWYMNKYII